MNETVIKVENASVRFNLNMQKQQGLKEYFLRMVQKEKRFQEFFALKNVNLTVRRGESWGFVGKNGSGKSTLLKLITGILRPYTGSVAVNGMVAPLLELGAGFDPELTGRENIYMNALILGMTPVQIDERFDDIVEFSELEQFLDVPLKNYSSGMKSRLGFAVATSSKPEILIADEVLSTGDRAFQAKCEKRMQDMLSGGTTLLFVSHSAQSVMNMCEKSMWLDHGTVRMSGETKDVLKAYNESSGGKSK